MFGSVVLDVALGLVFVYCFVSLICSAVREGIEGFLKTRAAYLERGIRELLQDPSATGLARAIYEHPLIAGSYRGAVKPASERNFIPEFFKGQGLPSYIPSRTFALALMDIAAHGARVDEASSHPAAPALDVATMRANLLRMRNPAVQRVLLQSIDLAQNDVSRVQAAIEQWYDSSMERVSGWYKRATQIVILLIGIVMAGTLNIDTIAIAQSLFQDQAVRDAVVAKAGAVAGDQSASSGSYEDAKQALAEVDLPIGWPQSRWPTLAEALGHLPGWLLTAFAASLGAPFWFDLLNKLVVVRSTVKPREKSQEEETADKRPAQRSAASQAGAETAIAGGERPRAAPPDGPPAATDAAARGGAVPIDAAGRGDAGGAAGADAAAVDSCGIADGAITVDEDLPAARGGVA